MLGSCQPHPSGFCTKSTSRTCRLLQACSCQTVHSLQSVAPGRWTAQPSTLILCTWSTCACLAAGNKPWLPPPESIPEASLGLSGMSVERVVTLLHGLAHSWRHGGRTGGVKGIGLWGGGVLGGRSFLAGWKGAGEGSWSVAESSKKEKGVLVIEASYCPIGGMVLWQDRAAPLAAGSLVYLESA